MPIPSYEEAMLPFLQFLSDGKEHSMEETREHIAKVLNLTEQERKQTLPSGDKLFVNRAAASFLGYMGQNLPWKSTTPNKHKTRLLQNQ